MFDSTNTYINLSKPVALFIEFLAAMIAFGYGFYHLFYNITIIGVLALLAFSGAMLSMLNIVLDRQTKIARYSYIIFIISALLATCYYLGIRGLLFVFPVTSCMFYVFCFRTAIICGVSFSLACLIAASHTLEITLILRFSIAIIISIALSIAFSYLVNLQKNTLENEANIDYLTKIMNRRGFNNWFKDVLKNRSTENKSLTIFYIDLDNFKKINDYYGHKAGDEVLKYFSKKLMSLIQKEPSLKQESCHFARLSGDEFVLVVTNLLSHKESENIAKILLDKLSVTLNFNNSFIKINLCIGVLFDNTNNNDATELLTHADAAMYQAKKSGKSRYYLFSDELSNTIQLEKRIELGLKEALAKDQFSLVFMPIYTCNSLQITGVEVLIRNESPLLKGLSPDIYIPIAEKIGIIKDIDLWVIETTLKKMSSVKELLINKNIIFAINISAVELHNPKLPFKLKTLLNQYDIPAELLDIEITETSLIEQDNESISTLNTLRDIGVKLSLDDFGTGYTAFNQLMNYPVNYLKIDRSFVSEISSTSIQLKSMVDVILSIAKSYKLKVIAEGVETEEQLHYLQSKNCDYVQGFYLSKPLNWEDFLLKVTHRSTRRSNIDKGIAPPPNTVS